MANVFDFLLRSALYASCVLSLYMLMRAFVGIAA